MSREVGEMSFDELFDETGQMPYMKTSEEEQGEGNKQWFKPASEKAIEYQIEQEDQQNGSKENSIKTRTSLKGLRKSTSQEQKKTEITSKKSIFKTSPNSVVTHLGFSH